MVDVRRRTPGETRAFVEGLQQALALLRRCDGDTTVKDALAGLDLQVQLLIETTNAIIAEDERAEEERLYSALEAAAAEYAKGGIAHLGARQVRALTRVALSVIRGTL